MKSVNLLEVENCCISIMLYKGKTPPSPPPRGGEGGKKILNLKSIYIYKNKLAYQKSSL